MEESTVRKFVHVVLSLDEHEKLVQIAKSRRQSIANVIRTWIDQKHAKLSAPKVSP